MNLRTIFIVSIISIFSICPLSAQTDFTGSISGKLIDEETRTGLDFVNVAIYVKNGSVPVKGSTSAVNGTFQIDQVTPGEYRIEATFIGYNTYKGQIKVTSGRITRLGTIMMKADSKLLGSVEVTGIRSAMKFDIDKRVFSVDQAIAAAGASASDILKEIPSVEVDGEGTVSLRNSSSVTIWINGKPSGLNADNQGQVLEQMPAEGIDKIEVITNPSSKFSAEGSAGIINIILKKDRKAGYFGSIRAGISDPLGYDAGGNFNYSSPKVDIYANLGLRSHSHDGNGTSNRQTFNTNDITNLTDTSRLNSETYDKSSMGGLFFRSGIDYHLNDKHTISLSGFGMDRNHNNDSEINYTYLDNSGTVTRTATRNSISKERGSNYEILIDYLWEIGEEHKFQTNLSYGKENGDGESQFNQTNYNALGNLDYISNQIQKSPSNETELEFQADYSKKFSDKLRIEAGLKSDWNVSESNSSIFDGTLNAVVPIASYINNFDYEEMISAIYGTLTGKIGKGFGYQFGLRGEITDISFTSTDNLISNTLKEDKNYFNLFPSVFLTYSFSEGNDLQLNYSRRINRPRGHNLNPFVDITDSTNITFGNPFLDPEFANSFELNYIKAWNNHSLSASAYYKRNNQVIQDIRYIENGVMYQTPSNVTRSASSGLEIISKNSLSKNIETTGTVNFYHASLDEFTYNDVYYKGNSGFSWNVRLNSTIILSNTLTGQVSGFFNAPRIVAQGETSANYSIDAGLRKSFFDRKLLVSLNGRNLLNSFKFENKTWGQGFYQESSNKFFGRTLQLNVTWNFGNIKPKEKPEPEENGDGGYSEPE